MSNNLDPNQNFDDPPSHGGGTGGPAGPLNQGPNSGVSVPGAPGNMIGSGQFGPFGPHPLPEPEMAALAMKIIAAIRGRKFALARGGMVRGPGTGHSDSIPAMLSNGEYVVRAAVARHPLVRALLEHLNRGGYAGADGYADGGPVFGSFTTGHAPGYSGSRPVRIPAPMAAPVPVDDSYDATLGRINSGHGDIHEFNKLRDYIVAGQGRGVYSPYGDPGIYNMIAEEGARASRANQIAARNNANLVAPNDSALSSYASVLARQGAADQTQGAVNAARLSQSSAAQDYIRSLFTDLSRSNNAYGLANQAAAISADQMERQANLKKRGALMDTLGSLAGSGAGRWLSPGGLVAGAK